MVFYCVISGCKTNRPGGLKLPLFSVPKDIVRRQNWETALGIKNLESSKHRVCEKHFPPENVIRCTEHRDASGNLIAKVPLRTFRLSENAIPSLSPNGNMDEKENIEEVDNPVHENTSENVLNDTINQIFDSTIHDHGYTHNIVTMDIKEEVMMDSSEEENIQCADQEEENIQCADQEEENIQRADQEEENIQCADQEEEEENMFTQLCENINFFQLPKDWTVHIPSNKNSVAFLEIEINLTNDNYNACLVKRSIIIKDNMDIVYIALEKTISSEKLNLPNKFHNFEELRIILNHFSNMLFCSGIADIDGVNLVKNTIGYTDCHDKLRHKKCHILTLFEKCEMCEKVRRTVRQKRRRMSKRNMGEEITDFTNVDVLHIWKKKFDAQRSALFRAKKTIRTLQARINEMKVDLSNIDMQTVLKKCRDHQIPDIQMTLIEQIIASAKLKSVKGQRYSGDWMMLCTLMYIRSPEGYGHLQKLNILPLPCARTVRRCLSLVETKCGLDNKFFE
ncbi:uncharacterized protein LOC122569389 [Bombus pyrosoma]|uniref:uncharacterized protein LOC122569389 n=1 Tax=Bombus pyrosoma TaxID=396416 RepID=UPI001CB89DC1|nr:uncharacterized protein LOC122569389 [Bombus pyrosoma]